MLAHEWSRDRPRIRPTPRAAPAIRRNARRPVIPAYVRAHAPPRPKLPHRPRIEAAQVRPLQQLRSRIKMRIREPAVNLPRKVVPNSRQRRRRRQLRIRRRALHLSLGPRKRKQSGSYRRHDQTNTPRPLQQTKPPAIPQETMQTGSQTSKIHGRATFCPMPQTAWVPHICPLLADVGSAPSCNLGQA